MQNVEPDKQALAEARPRVIVFSPVRVASAVLREVLHDLRAAQQQRLALEFWFYDDNDDPASSQLLAGFCATHPARVLPKLALEPAAYVRTEDAHEWKPNVVDRIIRIKNFALAEFLKTDAAALFLVDADVCVPPPLIEHLFALDLPIVSEVFWTRWWPQSPYLPNVWDVHDGRYHSPESVLRLRDAGQYEVGGLGACTMLRRVAVERGVSFARIPSLDFSGEDRHFCVRATCLGFQLYADTVFPPFHIYRESQLPDVARWRAQHYARAFFLNWLDDEWARSIRASVGVADHLLKPKLKEWLNRLSGNTLLLRTLGVVSKLLRA
ncbi:MAG: hypothetical protein HYR56_19205 [Acidobacteria bacterium]|nr:hypothetical protein [Acidobacteriota bacterium]MBI3421687.1 hypothetical protein [Acidobacteriota bacterium]